LQLDITAPGAADPCVERIHPEITAARVIAPILAVVSPVSTQRQADPTRRSSEPRRVGGDFFG
jgi:hypothetical protein